MLREKTQERLQLVLDDWREKTLPEELKASLEIYLGDSQGCLYPSPSSPYALKYIYQIASMTKPLTGLAAMILWEEGKFQLHDPLKEYMPEFANMQVLHKPSASSGLAEVKPAEKDIQIIHLMTHTSGIGYPFLHKGLRAISQYLGATQIDKDLQAHQSYWAKLPLLHEPGERWTYGLSTDVLGRFIELVAGQRFADFLQDRILRPLQMYDTGFALPESKWQRLSPRFQPTPSGKYVSRPPRGAIPFPYTSPGGGLYASTADYAKFLRMLLNKGSVQGDRIIQEDTCQFFLENHIGELCVQEEKFPFLEDIHKFSLGGMRHTGESPQYPFQEGSISWLGANHTIFWMDPQQDLSGMFMSQLTPFPDADIFELNRQFQSLVYCLL